MRSSDARDLLQPVREMPLEEMFWMQRSHGLALFLAPGVSERFCVPYEFAEDVVVNRRFHVKPLLPMLNSDSSYYVLALSQHRPRLLHGTRFGVQTVQVPNMPRPKEEELSGEVAQRGPQGHMGMRGDFGKAGMTMHGGARDLGKEGTMQYFRMVDAAVWNHLRNESAPLVLVGVEYLLPMYRSICEYRHLLDDAVQGNADHWTEAQIHERTWPIIEQHGRRNREQATARFQQLRGTGKASDDIFEIAPAAVTGKVDCLLVDPRARRWGTIDPHTNQVDLRDAPSPGDEDLIDMIAVETLSNRGVVFALEQNGMPTNSPVAALFRY